MGAGKILDSRPGLDFVPKCQERSLAWNDPMHGLDWEAWTLCTLHMTLSWGHGEVGGQNRVAMHRGLTVHTESYGCR